MSPLNVEVYNPDRGAWVKVGEVKPGDQPGSISHNKPDGSRELYLFECPPNNSKSIIYRSGRGIDINLGQVRPSIYDPRGLETIKELGKGESFEMKVKTDQSPKPRLIRFTHK